MVFLVRTVRGKVLYHNSPDGGWAWIVLAAGFCIMAIIFSVVRSLGIFYNDFKDHYGATNTQTSWIWAIATSMFGLASPIGGMLIRVFDSRRILMLSGILCCVGMIITLFATQLWMVYVGIGVIWGCGFSWSYISIITQINIYFSRWRSLANGVMAGGSAVGAAAMPILIEALREIYGWRGTMFILAGIALNICMFAALMRPISVVNATDLPKYRDLRYADVATNPEESQAMTVSREVLDYMEKADEVEVVTQASVGNRVMKFIRDYWLLAWYGLTQFVVGICVFIPVMFLAPLSKSIGFTGDQAALLLSMTAFGDMVFRPLTGITLSLVRVLERNILFFLTAITLVHAGLCLIPAYGSVVTAVGSSSILATCQLHVYNREGVFCGSAGKSELPKPDEETIKAAAKAFCSQDGKDAIRSGGLNIGGDKYRLIRDDDHIILRKKEEGAVFANTTKEYIIVGMTPNLKTQQGELIGLCEKAQSWLSG